MSEGGRDIQKHAEKERVNREKQYGACVYRGHREAREKRVGKRSCEKEDEKHEESDKRNK